MKLKIQMLFLVLAVFFTASLAFAFQPDSESSSESSMSSMLNGGAGGAGGSGGGNNGGGNNGGGNNGGGNNGGGNNGGGNNGGGNNGGGNNGGGNNGGGNNGGGNNGGGNNGGGTNGGGNNGGGNNGGGTNGGGTNGGGTNGGGTNGGGGGGEVDCTRTQGYWGSSPAGQARLIQLVGTAGLDLGNVNYSASDLDDILDSNPRRGDALTILAHQLIAAKLNILNGAPASAAVMADIAEADRLIGDLIVRPLPGSTTVRSNTALGQQMVAVASRLDAYNNGLRGTPHCD